MDDELVEDIFDLYRRVRERNEYARDHVLAELIMWELRASEILDLAADALPDDATGVDPSPELAMRRIQEIIRAYKAHRPDE